MSIRQFLAMFFCAAVIILFLVMMMGCTTIATDYQVKRDYERIARLNVMRGGQALCAVNGKAISPEDIDFWTRVIENWPAYSKAALADLIIAITSAYLYSEKDGDKKEVTNIYQSHYYMTEAPATP